jgi:integrase
MSATGIRKRHSRSCPSHKGGQCGKPCKPSYEAWVYSARDSKKLRKTFPDERSAKAWRADADSAVRRGVLRTPVAVTLAEAAEQWLSGARDGSVRARNGDPYKPSAIRSYEASLRLRVLPELGNSKLATISRPDLQDFTDRFLAQGLSGSTVQCTLLPVRAIYRRALDRGEVAINPTAGLRLPRVGPGRDRFADPGEAAALLDALPPEDRALWATAMYGGLRRGELMALRWDDVDLAAGVVHVRRGWDVKEGEIMPKTEIARRRVPVPAVLRDHLVEHRQRAGDVQGDWLVFGRAPRRPFGPSTVTKRARHAWDAAGLERITLHECRHTFASLMIAAGVNAKALQTYMGHANIEITYGRYGHLMPGNEDQAAGLLDAYLARADKQARMAQLDAVGG